MVKTLTILFFFLWTSTCLAQPTYPPVYEIKADTSVNKIPETYWQMLVDTNGKWTINDVQTNPVSERFHSNDTKKTGVGYSGLHHYWQRFRLKNTTGLEVKLVFSNRPWVDRYDLYIIRTSGKTGHMVSGHFVPQSERDGYKARYAVPVVLSPGEEIMMYKKIFSKLVEVKPEELFIGFRTFDLFVQQAYIDDDLWFEADVRNWLIAGILIFGFFLNFFFFWIVREKLYLFMALLLLVEGIWYLTIGDIVLRDFPVFKNIFQVLVTHCLFFFLVTQFVRHFLKTYKYHPGWDKLILALITLMVTTSLVRRFVFKDLIPISWKGLSDFISDMVFALLMTSLLLSFLLFRKNKDRLTNLSIVAAIPIFLLWSFGYGLRGIFKYLSIRYNTTTPGFVQWYTREELVIEMFCMGWFAILFTWILLQRYALLRKEYTQQALEREKEKTELMNQQKELLEIQVEERTAELKRSLEELKT
ncbi:MAG: hypothetical protein H7Y01_06955, partial [Ferruginibacter sp.]|nr:hypothetical protein [Chitinophagaceae bacterium]